MCLYLINKVKYIQNKKVCEAKSETTYVIFVLWSKYITVTNTYIVCLLSMRSKSPMVDFWVHLHNYIFSTVHYGCIIQVEYIYIL